jgi:hypothetical protein
MCFIVRLIAMPFTSWSDTTPAPNLGTESSSDAHPRPRDSAVTEEQKQTSRERAAEFDLTSSAGTGK